jgi:hypothetical protein
LVRCTSTDLDLVCDNISRDRTLEILIIFSGLFPIS